MSRDGGGMGMPKRRKWHTDVYADFGPPAPDAPSWDHAKMLIVWLNGKDRTDVLIGESGGEVQRFLTVCGGNDGRYLVVVEDERRGGYWYLVRPVKGDADQNLMVMVGGLPSYYPATHVHDLKTALAVARHYFETGRRDKTWKWQRGEPKRG